MRKDNKFWDSAWNSEELTKGTEMISMLMHKSAVESSYNIMGNVNGKELLEIGCGSGIQTIEFCRMGAKVTAIDVSENSIKETKNICKKYNFKNIKVKNVNAESLIFKDNTFDIVYINCTLMHTDKERVLKECLRVLKNDGILVIKEVLKSWLFAFPYRLISPYRKTMPNYVTLKDIKKLKAKHKEFYLFSTSLLFLFYILKNKKLAYSIFNVFANLDSVILKIFPFLRRFSWVTVAYVRK